MNEYWALPLKRGSARKVQMIGSTISFKDQNMINHNETNKPIKNKTLLQLHISQMT